MGVTLEKQLTDEIGRLEKGCLEIEGSLGDSPCQEGHLCKECEVRLHQAKSDLKAFQFARRTLEERIIEAGNDMYIDVATISVLDALSIIKEVLGSDKEKG